MCALDVAGDEFLDDIGQGTSNLASVAARNLTGDRQDMLAGNQDDHVGRIPRPLVTGSRVVPLARRGIDTAPERRWVGLLVDQAHEISGAAGGVAAILIDDQPLATELKPLVESSRD